MLTPLPRRAVIIIIIIRIVAGMIAGTPEGSVAH